MNGTRVWRLGLVAALVAVVAVLARTRVSQPDLHAAPASAVSGFSERSDRDVQIRVWKQALDADPVSAIALGQLAALHQQRGREGGTYDDYLQAETYARRSLALRIGLLKQKSTIGWRNESGPAMKSNCRKLKQHCIERVETNLHGRSRRFAPSSELPFRCKFARVALQSARCASLPPQEVYCGIPQRWPKRFRRGKNCIRPRSITASHYCTHGARNPPSWPIR